MKTTKIAGLYVAAPPIIKLKPPVPEALEKIGNWGWQNIWELHEAAMAALAISGCPFGNGAPLPMLTYFNSFAKFFCEIEGRGDKFDWFIEVEANEIEPHISESFTSCNFEDARLFVPALWARTVLGLALKGIVRAEWDASNGWVFVRWNGEKVSSLGAMPQMEIHDDAKAVAEIANHISQPIIGNVVGDGGL